MPRLIKRLSLYHYEDDKGNRIRWAPNGFQQRCLVRFMVDYLVLPHGVCHGVPFEIDPWCQRAHDAMIGALKKKFHSTLEEYDPEDLESIEIQEYIRLKAKYADGNRMLEGCATDDDTRAERVKMELTAAMKRHQKIFLSPSEVPIITLDIYRGSFKRLKGEVGRNVKGEIGFVWAAEQQKQMASVVPVTKKMKHDRSARSCGVNSFLKDSTHRETFDYLRAVDSYVDRKEITPTMVYPFHGHETVWKLVKEIENVRKEWPNKQRVLTVSATGLVSLSSQAVVKNTVTQQTCLYEDLLRRSSMDEILFYTYPVSTCSYEDTLQVDNTHDYDVVVLMVDPLTSSRWCRECLRIVEDDPSRVFVSKVTHPKKGKEGSAEKNGA